MADILPIELPDDPRIDAYRDIRERDLVGRAGLFVAEGTIVVEKLIASTRHRPLSLLIASKRVSALAPMLASLPDDVPVFVAAQPVIDAIAGFPLHRGALAIGRRSSSIPADMLLRGARRADGGINVLLLSGIANQDNMGGIFRNAAAFGIDAIILDADCCDPFYRKSIRVSVGAVLDVPFATLGPGDDPVVLLERHAIAGVALSPAGRTTLGDWRPGLRNAVLLGAEGPGLPPTLLDRMQSLRIEMSGGFDSLNVATTSGIVLHQLTTRRR